MANAPESPKAGEGSSQLPMLVVERGVPALVTPRRFPAG